jgi:hypothetical protein
MIQSATIQITPEILGLVASIDEFQGACRALGTLAPDRLSAPLQVATIESIGLSTRIEGSKLSESSSEPRCIRTVCNAGYMYVPHA